MDQSEKKQEKLRKVEIMKAQRKSYLSIRKWKKLGDENKISQTETSKTSDQWAISVY